VPPFSVARAAPTLAPPGPLPSLAGLDEGGWLPSETNNAFRPSDLSERYTFLTCGTASQQLSKDKLPSNYRPPSDPPPPSNGPKQSFQFKQIGSLLLPALNTYLPRQIAEPMKQKKRHEPPGQRGISARLGMSVAPQETAHAAGHSPAANVLGPSRSYSPPGHDVAKINKRCQPPVPGVIL
jgi:hypothetical protein